MSGTTAKQLNMRFPEATEYTLCSLSFLGKRKAGEYNPFTEPNGSTLPRGAIKILSYIWTSLKNFGKNAKITKARLRKKCGLSKGGVVAGLDRLTRLHLIEETKPNVYKIIPKVNGRDYFVLENYLHSQPFNVAGKIKCLSDSAVIVLDLIKSFYMQTKLDTETGELIYINYDFRNRKPINYFAGSEASISKRLHLPKSTVADAINELIHARLLFRNKRLRYKDENDNVKYAIVHTKGVTGNTLSLFTVPFEVLAVKQSSTYTPQEVEFDYNAEAEPEVVKITEAEIKATYAAIRAEAEAKASAARELVTADTEFCEAKAELMNATSSEELDKATPRYYKRLAELGISEAELNPQYQCSLCDDTGQNLDTGQPCLCREHIKQMIIQSKFKA